MRRRRLLIASLLLATAAAIYAGSRRPGPPAGIRKDLDREYPGWRFARLNDFNREQLGAGQHPAWVRGDFDGDGRVDWAVQVTHPGERFRRQSVLVYLAGPRGYRRHLIQSGGENEGIYLGRRPPGAYRDVAEDTAIVSRGDVLDVLYGQEASEAFVHRAGHFLSYTTGD